MSHAVESMMYAGAKPWHGLGQQVDGAITAADAIEKAGLNWEVELGTLTTSDGQPVSHKALQRATDKKILGVVGPSYRPLQNRDAFDWFNPFVDAKEATFETAGSLREGKRIWILAKLTRDPLEIVKNDPVEKFILLSNTHDGTMSVRCGFTPIRVVCQNTLAMAYNSEESSLIRVMHSKQVKENLGLVRDLMNTANNQFEATAEQYQYLAKRKISKKDLDKYVTQVFFPQHAEKAPADLTDRVRESITAMNLRIQNLFETGRGSDIRGVRGTWWGAYNAVTEHVTHELNGTDTDRRFDSLWFAGKNAGLVDDALDLAFEYAK